MNEEEDQQKIPLSSVSADIVETNEKKKKSVSKRIYRQLHKHSGIWYMIAGNIVFACCIFALKLIPADAFDIMIGRFTLQFVAFGSFARFYKGYDLFSANGQPVACALNMFMSSLTNLLYLGAFYFLPLSDLNTIKYTYIVWAAILSVIFLKEPFKIANGVALFLTCLGLVLATKPHFFLQTLTHIVDPSATIVSNTTTITTMTTATTTSSYYYLGVILASISAVTKSIQLIARKQLVSTKHPYSVMNFQFTAIAILVSIIYSIARRFWQPEPYPWKWMGTAGIAIGCFLILPDVLVPKALKRENVQLITILGSLEIIYAVILQYIFFRQTKSWIFYIGASLIVLSAIILAIDHHLGNQREMKKQKVNEKNQDNEI